MMTCPLCEGKSVAALGESKTPRRPYYACATCRLAFVPPEFFLTAAVEKSRYDHHENDPADPKYRAFLRPVLDAVTPHVEKGTVGLDYGCGPGPALVEMFREGGYDMHGFDPFYANEPQRLAQRYDFVTCSETAEHFHHPRKELAALGALLKPRGILAILTQTWDDTTSFLDWHYVRDDTHVMFYRKETFAWITREWGWHPLPSAKNVFLFRVE